MGVAFTRDIAAKKMPDQDSPIGQKLKGTQQLYSINSTFQYR